MEYIFALAGNPNSGKSTLFNALTGGNAHTGNWAGVTVEQKYGEIKIGNDTITIIDLPGIYSLSPYSSEEIVARNFLLNKKPDLIINIIDATNLERNLYLTTQLMETGLPLLIALNMMDEVEANGDKIDSQKISQILSIPLIPISAAKNKGIHELMAAAVKKVTNKNNTTRHVTYPSHLYKYAGQIRRILIEKNASPTFFTIIKILERDNEIINSIATDKVTLKEINNIIDSSENDPNTQEYGGRWDIIIGSARYKFIENITKSHIKKSRPYGTATISNKIDSILTNKYLSLPIFAVIMFFIFQATFGFLGANLSNLAEKGFAIFNIYIRTFFKGLGAKEWIISLLCDGALGGIGMVITCLPNVAILFFFLALLDSTGYMARIAFIMDFALKKVGLSGKAFVPMLMGFGCSIPGIMAARTLDNEKDRKKTIIITPFMSCSARMPVYIAFAGALFTEHQGLVIFSLYLLGMAIAIISSLLLSKTILNDTSGTFLLEMPEYRLPSLKNLIICIFEKTTAFITKAGSILLIASVAIWLLQSFDFSLKMVQNSADSIFGRIGSFIAPFFAPLGFGDWRSSVSLLSGFAAKESIVSALTILYEVDDASLSTTLSNTFSPLSAYSYMAFVLLYLPCVAAFAAMRRELNSWKWTIFAVIFQTGIAYIVSLLIYQLGILFSAHY